MILKNLFTGQQQRNRHREQTYGRGEKGGEGEMYGKSNMETYITICKIDSPLQCSGLENPMDGGAWKAAVHGVTEVGHN